jgi:hypothetical protein
MSDQPGEQAATHSGPIGQDVDYDPEVLEQVLDDAATGDRPDAFDPDAAAKVVSGDSDAEATDRPDNTTIGQAF